MGQTLSNGVYLPNEGERNCYAGLASNWQILNTAVGNIAEKAPLVHTHGNISNDGKVGTTANLPLITGTGGVVQAGSFGNAANTFCEGNDSRLSDARTPVAHTHTKSDVTDLLNSNFIPSANNAYDLGSSTNQWANIYGTAIYENGTALSSKYADLNSNNRFTSGQIISGNFIGNESSNNARTCITFQSNRDSNGKSGVFFTKFRQNKAQGSMGSGDLVRLSLDVLENEVRTNDSFMFRWSGWSSDVPSTITFAPGSTPTSYLGNADNPWTNIYGTTINGINPGALSLPDIYDSYDVVTTNWSTAYNQPNDLKINGADPSYPGWLFIKLDNCTANNDFVIVRYFHVNATNLTFFGSFIPTSSSYVLSVPIQAGITTKVWVSKIPTYCKYYACLGTVK